MSDAVEDLIIDKKEKSTDCSEVDDIVSKANKNLVEAFHNQIENKEGAGSQSASGANNKSLSRPRKRSEVQLEEPTGTPMQININGYDILVNSILNSHGWVTVEHVKMPYVIRGTAQKFIPLCVLERTLLKPYPGPYPEKELGRAPMMGFYFTTEEVRLMNRFVNSMYTVHIGLTRFSLKDMLVTLPDFLDFYEKVKSITRIIPHVVTTVEPASQPTTQGGWSQVNNTIVPYVLRKGIKMVPLSVVQYAAGLLKDVDVPSLQANQDECGYLNKACSEVGMDFQFEEKTQLLELFLVPTLSKTRVSISELPKDNPLVHARFVNRSNDRRSVFVAASAQSLEMSKQKRTCQVPVKVAKSRKSESDDSVKKTPDKTRKSNSPTADHQQISRPAAPVICLNKSNPAKSPVTTNVASVSATSTQSKASTSTSTQPLTVPNQPDQASTNVTTQQPHNVAGPGSHFIIQRPAPTVIQMPAPNLKICPQHGIRGVVTPQGPIVPLTPAVPQSPVLMTPGVGTVPQIQAPPPNQPVLVIRLNQPIPPDGKIPIILPPNMGMPGGQITLQALPPQGGMSLGAAPVPLRGKVDDVVIKIESDDDEEDEKADKLDKDEEKETKDISDPKLERTEKNSPLDPNDETKTLKKVDKEVSVAKKDQMDESKETESQRISQTEEESKAPFDDEHLESFLQGIIKQEACEEATDDVDERNCGMGDGLVPNGVIIKTEPTEDQASVATAESVTTSDALDTSFTSEGALSIKTEPEEIMETKRPRRNQSKLSDPSPPKRRRAERKSITEKPEYTSAASERPRRANAGKNKKYPYFSQNSKPAK